MIITTSSWKGGTGKTTLNILLVNLLAGRGYKILIIDLDSNCSISMVYDRLFQYKTTMDFLQGGEPGIAKVNENIDIIPSHLNIVQLSNVMDTQLRAQIRKHGLHEKYDFIIIDPPGYWGSHTRNAVFAADTVVIPGSCSKLDFAATELYMQTLGQCYLDIEIFIVINAFSKKNRDENAQLSYNTSFPKFIVPEPIPYIQSLKRLTADINYTIHPSVKKRLEKYVDFITGGHFHG